MHYFFVDESYRDDLAQRTIMVGCWAVEQGRLNQREELLRQAFRPPVEDGICSVLKGLDALALVASATLDKSLWRTGEIDGTDDIPAMARADNIWSHCVTFTAARLILQHLQSGRPLDNVDIYFDPKSLKRKHEEAWGKALRGLVAREAKRFAAQLGSSRLKKLRIRRIEPVTKPTEGQAHNKFQIGTWIADKLCAHASQMSEVAAGRINTCDMSDTIRRTVQQWDGRSFHDD
jgi:hypothetical protein